MKEKKVKSGKYLRVIAVLVVLLIAAAVGLTIKAIADSKKEFYQDGYILVPSLDKMVTTNVNEQYYFSEGTTYKNKLGEKIVFKDTTNKEVSIDAKHFVHYLDGALGSFAKGVVLDLADVGQEQVKYYGVSEKTIITKDNTKYSVSYLGKSMDMYEFIWKISDDTYMVVSPQVTLHLNNKTDVVLEDYVQVQYVAGGIARLVHQDGTYQTVADDAYIKTDSGLELRLTSRTFYKNGKESISLDSMVIDSSSNIKVDENEEEVKLPVFNVVNGKDGADGSDGKNGGNGDHGYEGATGSKGNEGAGGNEGQNGLDGVEGDGGDWGYDGKDGAAGSDAENAGASDGVASIDQLAAPRVKLENESYVVGPNSVTMNLSIEDPNAMLDSDLRWYIYRRDNMSICGEGTIPRGVTGQAITTNSLMPATEYVVVVSGEYTNDGYSYSTDFFTKIFKTDSMGITIEKVKVTEDSIIVKTTMEEGSKVGTYKIALYIGDSSTTNISTYLVDYVGGREFVFDRDMGVIDGVDITSDTNYRICLYDVKDNVLGALISTDVAMDVQTLKVKPHYKVEIDDVVREVPISEKLTKTITSSRYKSVAISLDPAIADPDNGIVGYRYELFETSSIVGNINDTVPTQVKEVEEMQTVNFDIDPEKNYIARVVVIFHDNEKKVELPAKQSNVFKLEQSTYPAVSFVNVVNEYDSVSGYVMVEDKSNNKEMLLGHVNTDYPIVLTIAAGVGDPVTINLYESATPPEGSQVADNIKYYYFSQDGLSRNTPYSMTVSGYVNETGLEWDTLIQTDNNGDGVADGIEKNCFQYIAGANFNSGAPTPIVLNAKELPDTGSNLFAVALGFTSGLDANGNPLDASYEVGNLEKISFSLINKNTGVVLGTYANLMDVYKIDDYVPKHESSFYREAYSAYGEEQKYSNNIVLTDKSFGVEGDSRIAAGGVFQIRLENAYDYTQRDEYKAYTNDMDISDESFLPDTSKIIFEFEVEQRHVQVSNPNDTVTVTQIQNQNAMEINPNLNDDTVVGLKIDSGYTVQDATKIIYYIYEVTSAADEPVINDNGVNVLSKNTWVDGAGNTYAPKAIKTITVTNSPSEGDGVSPWIVYFDSIGGEYSNLDDNDKKIFERGKMYFVRYEVVTDGTLEDVSEGDKYPDCVYSSVYGDANDYPFYRSNVFGIKRQEPTVQRYLWDTMTDLNGVNSHVWKYKIYDPDGAILAYAGSTSNAKMIVNRYANFDAAVNKENPETTLLYADITNLYGADSKLEDTFKSVEVTNLPLNKWYTLDIPYSVYNKNARDQYLENRDVNNNIKQIVSKPTEIKDVSDINTDTLTGVSDPSHPTDSTDYLVNGVMVKGASIANTGINDDYGYRIKITLAGTQLTRVSAVRVTITGEVSGQPVTVIYDPVPISVASGKYGTKGNNVAYAYLEYAPIVKAGINNKAVTVKVEAYYTTYQSGFKSFTEYIPTIHSNEFTTNGMRFTSGNAWAIKQYSYVEKNGTETYDYDYQKIVDFTGNFTPCPSVALDMNNGDAATKTMSGSIFVPTGIGFESDTLKFAYAENPLAYTQLADNSFSDVKHNKTLAFVMDEIGAKTNDGKYYQVEKLNIKTLKIDCGDSASNYEVASFITGDGMPGIDFSDTYSSSGMRSLYAVFNTKGELPGTDKGFYIHIYDSLGNKLGLDKYVDADGSEYYLLESSNPTSSQDTKIASADDGTETRYGTAAVNNRVDFAIRGLQPNTTYTIKIMAKNSTGTMQYLFDYSSDKQTGEVPYNMTTTSNVKINASYISYTYNEYNNKYGSINYGVEGSEGTGMRIFYRVYDVNGNEVDCGKQNKTSLGYLLVPKGNNIKYYHSDMTQCNPATINFNPGVLEMGAKYTVVFEAYLSDNDGNIIDASSHIGTTSIDFNTPALLSEPSAAMQIVAGRDNLQVTGSVTDNQRTIMNNQYVIAVYDLDGNLVGSQRVTKVVAPGAKKSEFTETFADLEENRIYIVKVTALVDTNNDGVTEGTYEYALAASTVSTASATVAMSFDVNDRLVIGLENVTNFDDVVTIKYTIDSSDGNTNYTNGTVQKNVWISTGVGSYSYITSYQMEKGQYYYTLQYYDATGRLIGSNTGRFNK